MPTETAIFEMAFALEAEVMMLRRVAQVCPACKGAGYTSGTDALRKGCITCGGRGARVIVPPFIAPEGEVP